jgi:hypothetical protein
MTAKVKKTMKKELKEFRKDFRKYIASRAKTKYEEDLLKFLLDPSLTINDFKDKEERK